MMIPSTYRSVDVIFAFYSVDCRDSFAGLDKWLHEIVIYAPTDVKVVIVGR